MMRMGDDLTAALLAHAVHCVDEADLNSDGAVSRRMDEVEQTYREFLHRLGRAGSEVEPQEQGATGRAPIAPAGPLPPGVSPAGGGAGHSAGHAGRAPAQPEPEPAPAAPTRRRR